ncbi:MAG: PepSY domain-containing protein [Sphingosinicella sp.]|nr:PepSY domain-containing protein [Sphingosinicella sp.]
MRKYHRWVSAVAALFLLIVSVTGVVMQVQKLTGSDGEAESEGRGSVPAALTSAMESPIYAALATRTLDTARRRAPNAPITSVTLRSADEGIEGVVSIPGEPPREIVVDARSGRVISDEEHEESLVRRIHSGSILGEPGTVLGILWGLALVILSITGAWVYLDMYRKRRRNSDKTGLFW